MVACKLKLICWLLLLSLQLSAILSINGIAKSRKEHGDSNGIVMTLHHMRSEEGFTPVEPGFNHDDQAYKRLAKMVHASKERASALKRGKSISGEGSLYGSSDSNEFAIKLSVGTPPQDLLLVMDTGSDLVWAPCSTNYTCNEKCTIFLPRKSSSAISVKCADPKCKDLCGTRRCLGSIHNCSKTCPEYVVRYVTGASLGHLLSETLTLPLKDGGTRQIKSFGVGCSVRSAPNTSPGIAGFGRGGLSMPSQLSPLLGDKFAYCLQSKLKFDDQNKSSKMVLGDKAVPRHILLNYTSFLNNSRAPYFPYSVYYYIGLEGVSIGGKRLKLPSKLLTFDSKGNGGTIIDSGTSFTTFSEAIFNPIAGEFASQLKYRRSREAEAWSGFELCYNISGVDNFQVPEFVFHFKGGSDMVLPELNTIILADYDTACLAMNKASADLVETGLAVVLGNYQQQNFYILYDREKNRLGFTPKTCKADG